MSTMAQINANQANAQLSTGPRTPEGKNISSRNAVRYGVTSKRIVLPWEDEAEFEERRAALVAQLKPATELERMLVDDIAAAEWRVLRAQAAQKAHAMAEMARQEEGEISGPYGIMLSDSLRRLQKYEDSYRRAYEGAWRKLAFLQKERRKVETPPPQTPPARAAHLLRQNEPNSAPLRAVEKRGPVQLGPKHGRWQSLFTRRNT